MKKSLRLLAAVCSALTLWLTGFIEHPACAEIISDVSESDSAIVARHIHEMKVEYAIEEFSDHSFNAQYSDHELDSILAEYRTTIICGTVVYSPDSAFKIVVVEGEGCGSYCNPMWKTWLHFNDGSGMVINNIGFERVTSIERMPDGKYLVWENTWGRTGSVGISQICATLLSVTEHDIKYYKFPSAPSQSEEESSDPHGSFCVYQTTEAEAELISDYHPENFHLDYQYTVDRYWEPKEDDTLTVYSGNFIYTNGEFVHEKESVKRTRPKF